MINISPSIMIILVGNIGLGKSTLAKKFAERGDIIISFDSMITSINGGSYSLYNELRRGFYRELRNRVISCAVNRGYNVVIDDANMTVHARKLLIRMAKKANMFVMCYDFGEGTQLGLKRRMKHNKGYAGSWVKVYKKLKRSYVKPTINEGFDDLLEVAILN